jgi:hypothetical protein
LRWPRLRKAMHGQTRPILRSCERAFKKTTFDHTVNTLRDRRGAIVKSWLHACHQLL